MSEIGEDGAGVTTSSGVYNRTFAHPQLQKEVTSVDIYKTGLLLQSVLSVSFFLNFVYIAPAFILTAVRKMFAWPQEDDGALLAPLDLLPLSPNLPRSPRRTR